MTTTFDPQTLLALKMVKLRSDIQNFGYYEQF